MVPRAYALSGSPGGTAAELAREVLSTVAAGTRLPSSLVERLVTSVLDREDVRLALTIREGGPHLVRRAIELAGVLLDAAEPAEDAPPVRRTYEVDADGRVTTGDGVDGTLVPARDTPARKPRTSPRRNAS